MNDAQYGQKLECIQTIKKRGVMDAVAVGNHLFLAASRHLYIADISNPSAPAIVGDCPFRGAGRQLAVADGIAYVTARADGVYIFDVHDPRKPELLCHYDCIELATGVEVQGGLLFIAQRQYGVEIVDVSDPRRPVHLSKIKTGEAQSVDLRGRLIYVGDWGTCRLTTIDISDAYRPEIIAAHDLDGYGDGVCVAGDFLYASTGHHSKHQGAFAKRGDPGFGIGHGLEVFSLAGPSRPRYLGRTKFPPFYERDGYDMWTPVDAGETICCADAFNGVFLVDVKNPEAPRTVAHYRDLVAGVAVVDDIVYAACPKTGLRVLSAPGLVRRTERARGNPIAVPPRPQETPKGYRTYRPGGQVWSVDFCGDYALVAAGMAGIRMVELWPEIREVSHLETTGFAVHACALGNRAYVSENTGGFSIWEHDGKGQLQLLGRYRPRNGKAVRQGMVYAGGTVAVLQVGRTFHVLDIADPAKPRKIAEHETKIIYGDQMAHGDVAGRYTCVWGHVMGTRWLDLTATGQEINTGVTLADTYSFFAGIVSVGDQFLCTYPGGYRLTKPLDTDLKEKPFHRFAKYWLGKPTVAGNGLFLTSRVRSEIAIVDITDLEHPRLVHQMPTAGNPSTVVVRSGAMIVPDSYNGLLVYDNVVDALKLKVDKQTFLTPGAD